MKGRNFLKTKAIVLRTVNYGEADRIVTFYTYDFGKLTGIAKGARQSQKRFANILEPISYLHMIFYRKSRDTMAIIESCDILRHYDSIRSSLEKTLLASYLLDLTNHFTVEDKKGVHLFTLLEDFLSAIEGKPLNDCLPRLFELRLLKLMGYQPALDSCMKCRNPVQNGNHYHFSVHDGGLICSSCYSTGVTAITISASTIRTLMMGMHFEPSQMDSLAFSASAADESRGMLNAFISHLLGRELKSIRVLDEIRQLSI
jgi:DNA repair protein RecO (recombination protein O)